MSDLPVCKICGYTDACLPRAGDHAEIAAMRAEVERLKAECESVARGAKLEADTNATLRAEIDTATRALREIAGDDPDDGCRQGHSKFAAQTLAEGLNRELLDSLAEGLNRELLDSLAAEKLAREKAERERDEARSDQRLKNVATLMSYAATIEEKDEWKAEAERLSREAQMWDREATKEKRQRDAAEERLRVAVLELEACRTYFELDGRTAHVQRIDAALASAKGGE